MWDLQEEEGRSGELSDAVTLILGDDAVVRCEDYTVNCAIIQQPATFTLRLSAGKMRAAEVMKKYPKGSKFALEVAGKRQFVGLVQGWKANGPAGSTSLELKGRDLLAALHDNDVSAEESFENVTYADLVGIAMKKCGVDKYPLILTNDANRVIKSGVGVTTSGAPEPTKKPLVVNETNINTKFRSRLAGGGASGPAAYYNIAESTKIEVFAKSRIVAGTGTGVRHVVHAKLGESWLDFVMRHLAKVGLFLFTGHDGSFILSTPAKAQNPSSLFVRQRGQRGGLCNVSTAELTDDATHRYSEVVIYARGLGRKHGRSKVHGGFVDQEVIDCGFKKEKVFRDVNVTNPEQAEFYARRMIAEANRNAWRLTYTFSGHTAPTMVPGQRCIPVPDTVARVQDDELGIHEDLYIESVAFHSPPRETTVTMMRLKDLVFEDDVERGDKPKAAATTKPAEGPLVVSETNINTKFRERVAGGGAAGPGQYYKIAESTKIQVIKPRKIPTGNPKL